MTEDKTTTTETETVEAPKIVETTEKTSVETPVEVPTNPNRDRPATNPKP